jgi:hypothetical protein
MPIIRARLAEHPKLQKGETVLVACSATVPDKNASGDNHYGPVICYQPFVDWAWNTFKFNYDFWQGDFGWDDCCNTDKPLARAFNAIWILAYSAEDWQNEDWSNNILHWGVRYAYNNMRDLRAACGDGTAVATTFSDRIELYRSFFYTKNAPGRAETIIHESRHVGGKPHNAQFPSGSVFGEGKNGADSDWNYNGAWMYGALYLWWFYADGRRTTSAIRELAKQRAQVVIDNAFATHPGFVIS